MKLKLLINILWILSTLAITCTEPDALDETVIIEKYRDSSVYITAISMLEIGKISGDYYQWGYTTPDDSDLTPLLRRITSDLTEVYTYSYSFKSVPYGFQVDSYETNAYALMTDSTVIQLIDISAADGSVLFTLANSNIIWSDTDIWRISLPSDTGIVFFNGMPSAGTGNIICKVTIGYANFEWIDYSLNINSYTLLAFDLNNIYFVTLEDSTDNALLIKGDFSDSNFEVFRSMMACPSMPCTLASSASSFSSDNTIIYNLIVYEDVGLFFGLDASTGSLSTLQYHTETGSTVSSTFIIQQLGTKIYFGTLGSYTRMYIYDTDLADFESYYHLGSAATTMYGWKIDGQIFFIYGKYYDMMLMGGLTEYFSKARYSNIEDSTPFSSTTLTVTLISTSDDYELTTGTTTSMSISSFAVSNPTDPTSTTISLTLISSSNSELAYYEDTITISDFIPYDILTTYNVILTCTTTGATSITYSIVDADLVAGPAWLTLDEAGQILTFNSPTIADKGTYSYYIYSTWSGGSSLTEVSFQVGEDVVETTSIENVDETPFVYLTHSSIIVSIFVIVMVGVLSKTEVAGMWIVINQLAMFVVLPLTGAKISDNVLEYLKSFNYALFNFDFIDLSEVNIYNDYYDYFMCGERSDYEKDIGLNSSCNLGNVGKLFLVIILIGIVVLLMYPIVWLIQWKRNKPGILNNFSVIFTSIYIRLLMQVYLMLCLSCIYDVYLYDLDGPEKTSSFTVSILIIVFQLIFLIFSFFYLIRTLSPSFISEKSYFKVLIFDSKPSKFSRHLSDIILMRLLLSSTWIVAAESLNRVTKTSGYTGIQLIFGLTMIILRPYRMSRNNVQEITNFLFYVITSTWLIKGEDLADWDETTITAFMTVISANFVFIAIFQIFIALKSLIWKMKTKSKISSKVENIRNLKSKSAQNNPFSEKVFKDQKNSF